jgi:hypothetical protein
MWGYAEGNPTVVAVVVGLVVVAAIIYVILRASRRGR